MRSFWLGLGLLITVAWGAQAELTNGLYAVWSCSYGNVTTRLHYVEAPRTVGNFVGLVEGAQIWVEEETGLPSNGRYYDGIAVNRVADIPERIIQTGSQNGTNSGGGPGYAFPDEFHAELRHDQAGVLSMANSGMNSNGSQVFFTLGPLPGLDDVHSIFGRVIGGLDVLTTIGELPVIGVKPTPEVLFDRVEIVRVGPDAEVFDPAAQGLPTVRGVDSRLEYTGGELIHMVDTVRPSELLVSSAMEPSSWSQVHTQWHLDNTPPDQYAVGTTLGIGSFATVRVAYPEPVHTPYGVQGARLTATDGSLDIQFGPITSSGTITVAGGTVSGSILQASWRPEAYRARLILFHDGFSPRGMDAVYAFTSPNQGVFKGYTIQSNGDKVFPIAGDFDFTPAP